MKATLISKENNMGKFTMDFTADELEKAIVAVYQREKGNYQLDGFRKGKVPRSLLEKRFGADMFVEEAVNDLVNQELPAALTELDLNIVDTPTATFGDLKKGSDFTATLAVTLYPEFDVTDYKGVEVEKVENEVTEDDINNELESMRKRNSRMIDVEGPAKDGDRVVIDYKGTVDGEAFEGGSAEGYPLVLGSNTFIPGFEEQLVGAKAGEDVEVKVTFPEEYHEESLAGKEAVFACKVNEIKQEELPELDDDFAKDTSEFDTLEELKAHAAEDLAKRYKDGAEIQMKDNALGKVYEANDIDIPDVMIETEVDSMMRQYDQQLRAQGMGLEQYMQYMGQNVDEFKEGLKGEALRHVKTRMIVEKIVEVEDIQASEEDVNTQLEEMAQQYGMELDNLKQALGEQNLEYIKQDVKMKNAINFIYDNAVFVEPKEEEKEEKED